MGLQEADGVADKIVKKALASINKFAKELGKKEEDDVGLFVDEMPAEEKMLMRKVIQECAGALSNDSDFLTLGMWSRGEHE